MRLELACIAWLSLGIDSAAAWAEPPPIQPGDVVRGNLSGDAGTDCAPSLLYAAARTGAVSFGLDSYDFDARLTVTELATGERVHDDNSGVETNALLQIHAVEGQRYLVTVAAADAGSGTYELYCATGELGPPAGARALELSIEYRSQAMERALGRDDPAAAAQHGVRMGHQLAAVSRYDAALAVLGETADLASQTGEAAVLLEALDNIGYCHLGLGDDEAAMAAFEELVEAARRERLSARQAETWALLAGLYRRSGLDDKLRRALTERRGLAAADDDRAAELEALAELCVFHRRRAEVDEWVRCLEQRHERAATAEERVLVETEQAAAHLARGDGAAAIRLAEHALPALRTAEAASNEVLLLVTLAQARIELEPASEASAERARLWELLLRAHTAADPAIEFAALASLVEIERRLSRASAVELKRWAEVLRTRALEASAPEEEWRALMALGRSAEIDEARAVAIAWYRKAAGLASDLRDLPALAESRAALARFPD